MKSKLKNMRSEPEGRCGAHAGAERRRIKRGRVLRNNSILVVVVGGGGWWLGESGLEAGER
ncbi:hypothetical protein A3J23_02565 [Candidatus Peregrinibacteria bacterium RIFCSPLOWO2_02_FULL_48_14]|nr:MAG: hypothetical protein A3J23_02565 [Candidatus Peregrinibacteria bacterium RIFCSPLOWO2_02_FULL_48_14]